MRASGTVERDLTMDLATIIFCDKEQLVVATFSPLYIALSFPEWSKKILLEVVVDVQVAAPLSLATVVVMMNDRNKLVM